MSTWFKVRLSCYFAGWRCVSLGTNLACHMTRDSEMGATVRFHIYLLWIQLGVSIEFEPALEEGDIF